MNWINAISAMHKQNTSFVLVTVLQVEGSAPREKQSKIVITIDRIFDSIGGGSLEHQAMKRARELLEAGKATCERKEFMLGQDLTQCCGGRVELLFECFPSCDFNVILCGAGHVGQALTKILAELPCRVLWLDSRPAQLETAIDDLGQPSNITTQVVTNPFEAIDNTAPGAFYLVMTHSHEIDFELCEAILARNDIGFCGLIGSKSKANSFRSRLKKKGYNEEELARLTSPVGLKLGKGKTPMEVAVSVAAQLIQVASETAVKEPTEDRKIVNLVNT